MTQRSSSGRTRAILTLALSMPSLVLWGTSLVVGITEAVAPAAAHAPHASISAWSAAASEAPLRSAAPRVESAGPQLRGAGPGEPPERSSVVPPAAAWVAMQDRAAAPPARSRRPGVRELLARTGRLADPATAPPSLTV